jgi:spore coat protein A
MFLFMRQTFRLSGGFRGFRLELIMRLGKLRPVGLAAFVTTFLTGGAALAQQSVTLSPSADNTIYSESDDVSNGAGDYFFAGRTNQFPAASRRALVKFNLAGSIPAGSTITSVQLTLYLSRSRPSTDPVALHRLLADWGEGVSDGGGQEGQGAAAKNNDATWRYRIFNADLPAASPAWSAPGGDYAAIASASIPVGGVQSYTWPSTAGLISDVQTWTNDPAVNFGWIMIGNESAEGTTTRYDSRTNGVEVQRPQLTVAFVPPASTGACCLPSGACQIATASECQSLSGLYQGNGSGCSPNPCPQPTGACCLTGGACQVVTQSQCGILAGVYQGNGTTCSPSPCPAPTGACCLPNASCQIVSAAQCQGLGGTYNGDGSGCTTGLCPLVLTPYVDALPRPAVMQPVSGTPGAAADYIIPIREFNQQLHRDLPPTRVWGYAGSYPGPTIEARRDLPVTVTWVNDLRNATGNLRTTHYLPVDLCLHGPDINGAMPLTVTHLHGGHVAPESDGDPGLAFPPGQQSPLYIYPNNQQAATIWYHDHSLGLTRLNVYMGLAGFYLIRDNAEDALNLPRGEYEVPLAIQDRTFNPDGTLKYHASWEEHFFGDVMLVNGKVWPYLNVKQGKYRLRLLNGCNSRVLTLALSSGATFDQISTDLGLLAAPVPLSSITLSPGERADVVVDFSAAAPGSEILLTNSAPAPFPGSPGTGVLPNVMKFIVQPAAGGPGALPATLVPVTPISETVAVRSRDLFLRKSAGPTCNYDMWLVNDLMWDDITEFPRQGSVEIWKWINRSGITHPMHMHLVAFQVLDRQDFTVLGETIIPVGPRIPAPASEAGWKDTVQAHPSQITRVIARFTDYIGRYPYHCHILEHEDHEMMRQFQVVCVTDFDDGSGTGKPDGGVGIEDLLYYLYLYDVGLQLADVDDGTGTGTPDGGVGIEDLLYFLARFDIGC